MVRSKDFFFKDGGYHICVQGHNVFHVALAQETDVSNFAFQVEMTILKGAGGGMILRAGQRDPYGVKKYDSHGYRFAFGSYGFDCWYGGTILLPTSKAVIAELNHSYLLTTIARGNNLSFYVDKKYLTTITDSRASSGAIGLMAVNFTDHDQAHVMYRHAQIWNLANDNQW
jgi:hypothetical protein